MKWISQGLIFKPENNYDWMISHAQVPFAHKIGVNVVRIFFGTRDLANRTVTTFVDTRADNPQNIISLHNRPSLNIGHLGRFDDCGAMPSWIIKQDDELRLFYTGWNVGNTVPYRLAIGVAVSMDNGLTFERTSDGPILDRSTVDQCWCAQPSVLLDNGVWRMWYLSCTKWEVINERPEPYYHVKYAESLDGFEWKRTGKVCIDYDAFTDAIGRPVVLKQDGAYKMFYSYRSAVDYRVDPKKSYRLGYAESEDGMEWIRKDNIPEIDRSADGWDSQMMEYCHLYDHEGKTFLLYNGNGFGRSGFGYAILEE